MNTLASNGDLGLSGPLRTVIVEDEALYRDLLCVGLENDKNIEVVGAFADAETTLAKVPGLHPQVAILDIELPNSMNGIQLGLRLRALLPKMGIVLLSNHSDTAYLRAVPPASIAGWSYLLKRSVSDLGTLQRAIMGAASGMVVLDPQLLEGTTPKHNGLISRLTPRQAEILALIAQGFSNAAIAQTLVLAPKSVENHINQLYQQLEIDTSDPHTQPRVTAVLKYVTEAQHPQ